MSASSTERRSEMPLAAPSAGNGGENSTTPPKKFMLLSLDGGGVRGISSLMILHMIMELVNSHEKRKGENEVRPFQVFDLAGGTSTGGLIALMLFRVRISTKDAIDEFKKIAQDLFSPRFLGVNLHDWELPGYYFGNFVVKTRALLAQTQFSGEPLEDAIEKMLEKYKLEGVSELTGDSKLMEDSDKGRMFVCATSVNQGAPVLFRSYKTPDDAESYGFETASITQAARATSAAPTFLPSIRIGDVDFWDGALLNNNPINQVWALRYDLAPPPPRIVTESGGLEEPVVGLVVSLGVGSSTEPARLPVNAKETLEATMAYAWNTNSKHEDFRRSINRENRRKKANQETKYYRFDVPVKQSIEIDDWQQMKVLERATTDWLNTRGKPQDNPERKPEHELEVKPEVQVQVQEKVEECANLIVDLLAERKLLAGKS